MTETPKQSPMTFDKANPQGPGWGLFLGGHWIHREAVIEVRNPFDGQLVDTVSVATAQDVEAAVAAAQASLECEFPTHARYEVLMRTADRVESHKDVYAWTIACEGSKTIREARREPVRAATLFRLAAEEGRRLSGETLPFDSRAGSENRRDAFTAVRRLDVGAVIVNDSTDYRLDVMPFGGTKMSGIGREGIRFAMQEMTETRVVCVNL